MAISISTGAIIKCFSDYDCTEELPVYDSTYSYRIGPITGMNGTDGDYLTQSFFIKNVGDTFAKNIVIQEVGDNSNLFRLSLPGSEIASTFLSIDNLAVNAKLQIIIYAIIPEKCKAVEDGYINYNIYYKTTPGEESSTTYFVDETTEDILLLNNTQDNYYEYTITPTSSEQEIFMNAPVRLIYGAKDEVMWSEDENCYKIRLQCPKCNTWSSWYKLGELDVRKGIDCTSCGFHVYSTININTTGKDEGEHELSNKRIDFTSDKWTLNTISGMYELVVDHPGTSIGTYKLNPSGSYGYIGVNHYKKNNQTVLVSFDSFTGYTVFVEDTLQNILSKSGKPYGYGPYGDQPYGQEGLIHIQDGIDMQIPILGQKSINMVANYDILTKYDGTEANIEDIQSYYTERYSMLGCYDGPALPLWTDTEE